LSKPKDTANFNLAFLVFEYFSRSILNIFIFYVNARQTLLLSFLLHFDSHT